MKFRKFGKALLMSALSVGAVLSVTSCVQSYTVGFLYVTGTQTTGTSGSSGQGIISGFKIDHNTGRLLPINGLPIATGGANPGRMILIQGSRFLYVLNQGTGGANGGANITQFAVGGNGILTEQEQFFTQGINPIRILADSQQTHIYVLDEQAPSSASCALALGPTVTSCGDITAFNVDPATGRLSLLVNAQVTSASGQPLPYFPVPANPIDMLLAGSYLLTLSGTPATGDSVYPYQVATGGSGQLSVSQNGSQPLGISQATAIQSGSGFVYVLDNEAPNPNPTGASAQILPFSVGNGGSLQAQTGGAVPDDPTESNPRFLLVESKGKWTYVANAGDNSNTNNPQSGITGYVIDTSTKELTPMSGSPFASPVGIGAGPACLVEDPSDQFFYTANFNNSTVTGVSLDTNSGNLKQLQNTVAAKPTPLLGPAAYCLIDGRTS